jgi:DNA repair protein RecN (Recombination protein N)
MLTALSIRDLVLIEALDLDLGGGLLALTGETGAGKSILLDGLGLVLGTRGDPALVRPGAASLSVAAEFAVAPDHPARALLAAQGLEADGPILLRRQVRADGGGRAFAQDAPVSVGLLRQLGATLVEIHGQSDELGLLSPRAHRTLLDAFGGHGHVVAAAGAAWRALGDARTALAQAEAGAEASARERDWLEHAVAELRALACQPGEEAALADERERLRKGARLGDALADVSAQLGGSDGALARLRVAARKLERLAPEHALLAEALTALDRALGEADEGEAALARAVEALGADPARLEAVEARLFDLRAMARKHRVEAEALPALMADIEARLAAAEAGAATREGMILAVAEAQRAFDDAAAALSAARAAAAARLEAAVAAELAPLRLGAARFRVALAALAAPDHGPHGADRVEFEIATNPGAPFGPLQRVASGGELSRLALALKVALAGAREPATLIFDEIDRGVGGAVASAIGERLARLAASAQILVVTHSPQVAAAAARQWLIEKAEADGRARTRVTELSAAERREEIARMLSGADVTAEARAQAARLLGAGAPAG